MKKNLLVFIIALSFTSMAQTSFGLRFNTGDTEVEAHLNDVNGYASADISLFRKDLSVSFSASKSDLDLYLVTERMRPADVYYGYVISYTTGKKIYDVMKLYKKKKGWGNLAKDYGIKPGSEEFHRLKKYALGSIDKEKVKNSKNKSKGNKKTLGKKGR